MIVVDTNVVSELMRRDPDPAVLQWVAAQAPTELRITVVTVAEVLYGIERLPASRRRTELRKAATQIIDGFTDDVLPFDQAAAAQYAALAARREAAGQPISTFDAVLAAICKAQGAVLASRNGKDFGGVELRVVDPWTDRP